MTKRMLRVAMVVSVVLLCFTAAPAFSQSEPEQQTTASAQQNSERSSQDSGNQDSGNQGSGEDETAQFRHSPSVHLLARITGLSDDGAFWLAVLINFAIVVGLIGWLWKKNVPAMFRSRTASIQKSIAEAQRASEDANRRLADVEARLKRLDQEISEMRATSENEAAAEEQRIKAAAAEDARRIVESAGQEIAASAKAARRELTAYAADLAVSLAAKQIHVDTPADQALVRRFAQQLSNGSPGKKT
jgi:F-type H+-transporting ATPase subunit b